ncbi:MAG: hypothetical protein HQL46_14440 [Gammaproteobacteria bacterium]|nr:hypothetical protein [Gammaproteobacteria bacterium]
MKNFFRKLFSFILKHLESGTEAYEYKQSHRTILVAVGSIFIFLASIVFWLAIGKDPGYLFPVIVFGGTGVISLIVGLLGNDRAVSKIWGLGN